jgi:hypothetical protein
MSLNNMRRNAPSDEAFKNFSEASMDLLFIIGDYAEKIGQLEKKSPEVWRYIQKISTMPSEWFKLIDLLPDKEREKAYRLILRLLLLLNSLGKLDRMSADEKINFGSEVKEIVSEIKKMMKDGTDE